MNTAQDRGANRIAAGLKEGDLIALVAPSSPVDPSLVSKIVSLVESWGFRSRLCFRPEQGEEFLADSDKVRTGQMNSALEDPEVAAVWAVRGGYGLLRILGDVVFPDREHPPLVVGYSDVSLLLMRGWTHAKWLGLHAPNAASLVNAEPDSVQAVKEAFRGNLPRVFQGLDPISSGTATGNLLVMNLSSLVSVLATPWEPDLADTILAVEDWHEPPYRLDRLLTQIFLSFVRNRPAGLLIGDLDGGWEGSQVVRGTVSHWTSRLAIPCSRGFPIGHGSVNRPVLVGAQARMEVGAGVLEYSLEP